MDGVFGILDARKNENNDCRRQVEDYSNSSTFETKCDVIGPPLSN